MSPLACVVLTIVAALIAFFASLFNLYTGRPLSLYLIAWPLIAILWVVCWYGARR